MQQWLKRKVEEMVKKSVAKELQQSQERVLQVERNCHKQIEEVKEKCEQLKTRVKELETKVDKNKSDSQNTSDNPILRSPRLPRSPQPPRPPLRHSQSDSKFYIPERRLSLSKSTSLPTTYEVSVAFLGFLFGGCWLLN